jgi:hypothetical protein
MDELGDRAAWAEYATGPGWIAGSYPSWLQGRRSEADSGASSHRDSHVSSATSGPRRSLNRREIGNSLMRLQPVDATIANGKPTSEAATGPSALEENSMLRSSRRSQVIGVPLVEKPRWIPTLPGTLRGSPRRLIGLGVAACIAFVLFGSVQIFPQLAQGTTRSVTSLLKGSPAAVERRLCLGIPLSAVAPLYSVKVGAPSTGYLGSTCDFVPVGMSVKDDDASPLFVVISVNDYGSTYGTFVKKVDFKLSGVGSKAYWDWGPEPQADAPRVVAEKGNVGCTASTNGAVDHTTLAYTIAGGNPVVTNAAGAEFAAKLGVVCSDVFKGK